MDDLPINARVMIPAYELYMTAARSSGPGGQHANKSSSAVTLRWAPAHSGALTPAQKRRVGRALSARMNADGELYVTASDERSQARNRALARERLAELVRAALVIPKRRIKTKPTRGSERRRLKAKRERSELKKSRRPPKIPPES